MSNDIAPVRVVLVDDDPLVRAGLRMLLHGGEIEIVAEGDDGRVAQRLVEEHRPDVVLMDVRMPGVDGVTATQRLTDSGTRARVIVLTTFDSDDMVVSALRAGAQGFLLKDTPPADLVHAIRRVAGGDAVITPRITRRMLDLFGTRLPATGRQQSPAERDPRISRLTGRELEVFTLVARGLSNSEIAADLVVSETTVKTHVGAVLGKLELRDRVQAVVLAYETGIVQPA